MLWLAIIKFVVAFVAIATSLLFVTGIISAIVNPQIKLDENGKAVESGRNARVWLGLITSIFWAILIALP